MEDGFFVTGVEVNNAISPASQVIPNKSKPEPQALPLAKASSSNKPNRNATTAATKPKTEPLPAIQNTRDAATAKPLGLRNSMTEQQLKKPLFQKLVDVKDLYEKTKSPEDKGKSSSALKQWKTAKKEDRKNYTHADAFNLGIVQKFDELYNPKKDKESKKDQDSKKDMFSSPTFENIAKKKHFFEEIEKQEARVQGAQKKYNDTTYEITRCQTILEKLKTQCADLDRKLVDTDGLEKDRLEKENLKEEWLAKIELAEHNNKCLQHMKHMKKELLLSVKKKFLQEQDLFAFYKAAVAQFRKEGKEAIKLRKKLEYEVEQIEKKGPKENLIDPEFEDLLGDGISEFEERRNLREILKHEKEIEEELRLQHEEDERKHALARENRLREEENKRLLKEAEHEKELNKYKKQYHEFQKVTHVSRKDQLLEYLEGLEEKTVVLENEIEHAEQDIKAKKEELLKLQKESKFKKFEEEHKPKDNFKPDLRFEDFERMLRERQAESAERENHIKRLEKVSYEVCTVISRILKQLQKSKTPTPVDQANVVNLLSICGLKLERMLTVVIKKRKTFFIESINTDGTIKEGPPSYMNLVSYNVSEDNKIMNRIKKELFGNIVDEELQDEELSEIRGEIKKKDKGEGEL